MSGRTLVILLASANSLRGGDWFNQFWPELNVFVRTGESSRIYLLVAGTRTKADGYTDGQLGVHMDFYFPPVYKGRVANVPAAERNKLLAVRVGYLFGKAPSSSPDPFTEHTALIEVTPRFPLPCGVMLADRNRGDLRVVDGDFLPRYRNRLKLERSIAIGRRSLTPYIHAEAFYDWRYRAFHRQRYAGAAEFEISRRFVLEGYYLRQEDSRAGVRGMNVGGAVLQIYLY